MRGFFFLLLTLATFVVLAAVGFMVFAAATEAEFWLTLAAAAGALIPIGTGFAVMEILSRVEALDRRRQDQAKTLRKIEESLKQ